MKRQSLLLAVAAFMALPLSAQDIYKMETFSGNDLNGTARYVGMGGAMNALGADISTIGNNPAGIGLFRRSDVSFTASALIQPNAEDFNGRGKTRLSFDQAGFVYSGNMGGDGLKFINFGFNYQKRRNFKNFVGVDNFSTGGLSQSWELMDLTYVKNGWLDLDVDKDREMTTPTALGAYETGLLEMQVDDENKVTGYNPVNANSYNYKRVQFGGIKEYDFNLSFNYNDQIYVGFTLGIHDVNFKSYVDYGEMIYLTDPRDAHEYYMTNEEELTGEGYDFKFGVIMRPLEESPFRLGVAFQTPTYYDLKSYQYLYMNTPFARFDNNGNQVADFSEWGLDPGVNEYKIRTPWKFLLSAATTVGNFLALDAEYEYSDHAASQVRYGGYGYDYYDEWSNGEKDRALKKEAERFLKPVSTLRVGAEARVADGVYFRAGYNYESSPFDKDAFLNLFTNSSSYYYANQTDYVNLSDLHRITCGLGLRGKHFYADFAYQYQQQTGDLYTFHVPESGSDRNRLSAAQVDLNRHQAMLTLGYKF